MASATPSPLASSVEKTNGAKLSRLLIDGGTTVLRNVFNGYHPPASLSTALNANYSTLYTLFKKKKILNRSQWDLLFPPSGAPPDSQTFDITLLFLLLTNICGLSPPLSGWNTKPPPSDDSFEANLARIKFYRNTVYGHVTTTGIADPTFSTLWQEISVVLVALGLQQAEIDRLKAEHCGEQEFLDALLEWADSEKETKSQLKDMETKVLQTVGESKVKLVEVHQLQKNLQESVSIVHQNRLQDSKAIQDTKLTVEKVCEKLQTLEEASQHTIQNLNDENESIRDDKVLAKLANVDNLAEIRRHASRYVEGTRLSILKEVESWLADKCSPNRVIVISGNAGMGKSVISAVLCQKMLEAGRLSGSHFCRHNMARRRNPKLSESLPEYRKALVKKLSRNVGVEIGDIEVEELFEFLFNEPLSVLKDPGSIHLMVIDGLDESEYQGRNELLNVIADYFKTLPCWIRFVVTTRPEMNISEKIQDLNPIKLNPNDQENLIDVRLCFQEQLEHVLQSDCQDTILEKLVEKSEGVMLYTYYLTEFVKKNMLCVGAAEVMNSDLPSGISSVYQDYFKRLKNEMQKELGITEEQFFDFLNAMVAAREPLPVEFVYKLFLSKEWSSVDEQKVRDAVDCISALLPIEGECIDFFHKSVKDWLVEESTSRQKKFIVSGKKCHRVIAKLCRDELDELKHKGIQSSTLKQTSRYALQHGVQHILEVEENARRCSLDDIVKNYVLDLELVYAKLTVKSTAATEDVLCVQEKENTNGLSKNCREALETLLLLLRKHLSTLSKLPHAIFQILLNEGGRELSAEALSLLNTKYADLPYMEYLRKKEERTDVLLRFFASDEVICFDVSPNQDYLVCECMNNTIHLWSLRTAQLIWTRSALVLNIISRRHLGWDLLTPFFRSVVFHPTLDLILQGTLSQGYTLVGDVKPLFRSSKCQFLVCSISGDKTTMLTDSPDQCNCVIQWSLKDGSEISRFTHKCEILSFAWSASGRRMVIVDSEKYAYLIDMNDGVETLICPSVSSRYVKLTTDCRFFFCLLGDERHRYPKPKLFCLDIDRNTKSMYSLDGIFGTSSYQYASEFETCNESGFLSGDPFWYPSGGVSPFVDFALVLEKQMLLRVSPHSEVIEMCRLNDVMEWRVESSDEAGLSIESGDITTERTENNHLTEHNLPEIIHMLEQKAEIDVLSGQRAEVADPSEQRAELGGLVEQTMERNNSTEKRDELDDFVGERTEFNDPPENRLKLDELLERLESDPCSLLENGADPYSKGDDQEQQEPLLEDMEENGFVGYDLFPTSFDVHFSVDGDSLYIVEGTRIQRINLVAGDVLSKRIRKKECMIFAQSLSVVPVKRGVLFRTVSGSLELWNSDLSVFMKRWTEFPVDDVVPLSEERVALKTRNNFDDRWEVTILDTTSEKIVSKITNFDGLFLACNNKWEVLATTDGESLQLWRENRVLWETSTKFNLFGLPSAIFSPTEENVVTYCAPGSYVLDAVSGKVIRQLENMVVDDIKFISNEECIVSLNDSRGLCLRLYNVKSGDLLSEIVEERPFQSFAVCPRKRLVAIGFRYRKDHFEIIQAKLPGDKEKTNIERLNLPE
ncbi:LOW QUALITY PROTEIN: uncharacterized protein [Pocillopora verrucosa]|uniref:LOW QUALITY PROTEIN: uncharacterized protein n=1 Tax=Pocillopora verrucosa TaxID=203993 RepID=UPI00333F46E6